METRLKPVRTHLITGGTSGIGRAAALLFAAMGENVAVTGRRADRLAELVKEAEKKKLPGKILALEADVTDRCRDAARRRPDSGGI